MHEVKSSLVSLLKVPTFCFTIILTLGITFGAVVTAFSLNYLVFVKPLVYKDSERLVVATQARVKNHKETDIGFQSYPALVDWYNKSQSFEKKALIASDTAQITSIPSMPLVNASYVTPEYFDIASATMQIGRSFTEAEGLNKFKPSVILSDRAWSLYFNRARDVLGKTVTIEDSQFVIVGVLAGTFQQPQVNQFKVESLVYLPWDYNLIKDEDRNVWDNFMPHILFVGKVHPTIRIPQAELELTTLVDSAFLRHTQGSDYWKGTSLSAKVMTFEQAIIGDSGTVSALFFAGVFALLLIAVANATNLFLSRIVEKRRQLAIQAALGAQKRHIFRVMLSESACLAFFSLALSLLVNWFGILLLQEHAANLLPRLDELSLTIPSVIFMIVFGVLLSFTFAGVATQALDYHSLNNMLQSSGKGSGLQISSRLRSILAASQITLAIVLLAANFSLMYTATMKITQPLGIDTQNTYFVTVNTGNKTFSDVELGQHAKALKSAFKSMPEIEAASVISATPFNPRMTRSVFHPDRPKDHVRTNVLISDKDFQNVFSQKLINGRQFTEAEVKDEAKVAILSESLARALYGNESAAINQTMIYASDMYKIVAVVADINNPSSTSREEVLYLPGELNRLSFALKRKAQVNLNKLSLSKVIKVHDSKFRIFSYYTFDELHSRILKRDIATAAITFAISILTLLLASIGLYGVLSYNVKMRQYELGVRMAIGASPLQIVTRVILDNSKAIAWGSSISILIIIVTGLGNFKLGFENFEIGIYPSIVSMLVTLILSLIISLVSLNGVANRMPIHSLRNTD